MSPDDNVAGGIIQAFERLTDLMRGKQRVECNAQPVSVIEALTLPEHTIGLTSDEVTLSALGLQHLSTCEHPQRSINIYYHLLGRCWPMSWEVLAMHAPVGEPVEGNRVLIFSQRGTRSNVARCFMYEFEDVISSIDNATTVTASYKRAGLGRAWRLARQIGRRYFGAEITPKKHLHATPPDGGKYDLFFAYLASPQDVTSLNALPSWRSLCHQAVCWIDEAWLTKLDSYQPFFAKLSAFDHVFVSFDSTVEAFNKALGNKCHYLPCGVDAELFAPLSGDTQRSIDFFWPGRRTPAAHQSLVTFADHTNRLYLFDTLDNLHTLNHREHRKMHARILKQTKYFFVNKAKFDEPHLSANQEIFGSRFFEGIAAGAILVGMPPQSDEFKSHFDWADAVIEVPLSNGDDVIASLGRLDQEHSRILATRESNIRNALRRHDWLYRWENILALCDLPTTPKSSERRRRLRELSDSPANPSTPPMPDVELGRGSAVGGPLT